MSRPDGVIHDIGYRRYDGPRLGRWYALRSLYVHSLRTAYGLGRPAKAKIFPWLVVTLVAGPAVVLVVLHALTGMQLLGYRELVDEVAILLLLFVAVVAPELVSRDLRNAVLPLYFARPLRRGDYPAAKFLALVSATWLMLAGTLLVMYVGAVFTIGELAAVWREARPLAGGLAYAALVAVVFSAVALAVSSFIGRRAVAAGVVVGVFIASLPVVGLLESVGRGTLAQVSGVFSPFTLVLGVEQWLFGAITGVDIGGTGPVYGLATVGLVAGCLAVLLLRYRRMGR